MLLFSRPAVAQGRRPENLAPCQWKSGSPKRALPFPLPVPRAAWPRESRPRPSTSALRWRCPRIRAHVAPPPPLTQSRSPLACDRDFGARRAACEPQSKPQRRLFLSAHLVVGRQPPADVRPPKDARRSSPMARSSPPGARRAQHESSGTSRAGTLPLVARSAQSQPEQEPDSVRARQSRAAGRSRLVGFR